MNGKRILLVDDDTIFRDRLAVSLDRRGHDVTSVASLEDVERLDPDIKFEGAIIDLRLDTASGLDVARVLRKRIPNLRILLLTGYGSIASAVDAMRLGAIDYLTKPSDTDQVEAALFGSVSPAPSSPESETEPVPSLDRVEWEHLQRVLKDCGGNISQAARVLRIERRTLQRKLAKFPPQD